MDGSNFMLLAATLLLLTVVISLFARTRDEQKRRVFVVRDA